MWGKATDSYGGEAPPEGAGARSTSSSLDVSWLIYFQGAYGGCQRKKSSELDVLFGLFLLSLARSSECVGLFAGCSERTTALQKEYLARSRRYMGAVLALPDVVVGPDGLAFGDAEVARLVLRVHDGDDGSLETIDARVLLLLLLLLIITLLDYRRRQLSCRAVCVCGLGLDIFF